MASKRYVVEFEPTRGRLPDLTLSTTPLPPLLLPRCTQHPVTFDRLTVADLVTPRLDFLKPPGTRGLTCASASSCATCYRLLPQII
ncbi:hypothetical protein E2C01_039101 [Portunus trituberculatus]|uniref:Uncharacterized protein n=1 Tax=Portunus trituberculatus TaxID=210409 RepID=A0A5B7FJT5_PORTR|nr:hypothetical protein [Portunus trituberculatus]